MGKRWTRFALVTGLFFVASTMGQAPVRAAPGFEIKSRDIDAAGRCLDHDLATHRMQMWECHDGNNQDWYIYPGPNWEWLVLREPSDTWCVRAPGGQGVQLTAADCRFRAPTTSEKWLMHPQSDGWFALESLSQRGQCMDIRDWGRDRVVQLHDCHWGVNQQWRDY